MYLEKLSLVSFRSYKEIQIKFHKKLTFIYGKNAIGKTNILEAISYLSLGKSFRGNSEKESIYNEDDYFYISANYLKNNQSIQVSYGYENKINKIQRKIKIDNKIQSGRKNLIGGIICVIFSPNDIAICEGSSSNRRKFIDTVLCFQDKEYLLNLILYNNSLKQRNALLKSYRLKKQKIDSNFEIWNNNLVKFAKIITQKELNL